MNIAGYACSAPVGSCTSRKVWAAHSLIASNAIVQPAALVVAGDVRQSSTEKHLCETGELAVPLRAEHSGGPAVVACLCEAKLLAEPIANRLLSSEEDA